MGHGRLKAVTKRIVRRVKYHSPRVNFVALEQELINNSNETKSYATDNHSINVNADMSKEELAEYMEWAKSTAQQNHNGK